MSTMPTATRMFRKLHRLALFSLLLLLPALASARVYLVSVGVSDYPGNSMDLRLPAKDAQTITWLYSKNSTLSYSQLLNEEATTARIVAAMNKVFTKAGTDDIVIFFFSGHGYPGGFCAYDGNLDYRAIRQAMARSKCKNKMIFADACFAGKMRSEGRRPASNNASTELSAAKRSNVMLFLSSRSNETSIERPDMQNGLFTTFLQKGLRGAADTNKDRVITARELFNYVHAQVSANSNDKQHPVMWGKFSDHMPVMSW